MNVNIVCKHIVDPSVSQESTFQPGLGFVYTLLFIEDLLVMAVSDVEH